MTVDLPEYYFRIRENGAAVFRVDTDNRQRRIAMEQIAVLNIKNGEVRPQGDRTLSPADTSAIDDWMRARRETLAARERDEIQRTIEQLNLATQWAQSRASAAELDAVTDELLLAMHDLRSTLVRKMSDRVTSQRDG